MKPLENTLQIISIQHELAMSIGVDLYLKKMANAFLARCQKRLSLLSAALVVIDAQYLQQNAEKTKTFSGTYQYPASQNESPAWLDSKARQVFEDPTSSTVYQQHKHKHYYFLTIPEFGVLILERQHQHINDMVLSAISSLMSRLSISCKACLQHQILINEVEARTQAEARLIDLSLLDSLTELPNRKMLDISLHKAIANAKRSHNIGAIFLLNLDRFKVVNESVGRKLGDKILKVISQRLQDSIRQGDTIARVDGDEFIVLANELDATRNGAVNKAKSMAEKLANVMATPINIEGSDIHITISTGISLFPLEDVQNINNEQYCQLVLKNADLAMQRVKNDSRNCYSFFSQELMEYSQKRTTIEKLLKQAIENSEFSLNYQPLVNKKQNIVGAEALIRWQSKEMGWVSPADFIPIAEDCGLILAIGDWVIETACQLAARLASQALTVQPKYISINVSPRQFSQPDFVDSLMRQINKYKIPPQRLRIEITEGVAIDNIALTINKIEQLRVLGIDFMLDDFGSGYSSLSYLQKLPLKTIKIDRSFIQDVDSCLNNQVITRSIIDICEHFSLECIVEGVETEDEYTYLNRNNITAFQGYYFHKPLSESAFIALLK